METNKNHMPEKGLSVQKEINRGNISDNFCLSFYHFVKHKRINDSILFSMIVQLIIYGMHIELVFLISSITIWKYILVYMYQLWFTKILT